MENPQGELIDVCKIKDQLPRILSLEDPSLVFEGKQINNIRHSLGVHPSIPTFFALLNKLFEIQNKGGLGYAHGKITLPAEVIPIRDQLPELDKKFGKLQYGRNDQCPCGSGTKFKKCCG
jgi:SEC-C motif-containing protein